MICRDGLDHMPLPPSITDSDLRPYAMQLLERIRANDSEAACPSAKVARDELIADFRGPRTYGLEAKITHL